MSLLPEDMGLSGGARVAAGGVAKQGAGRKRHIGLAHQAFADKQGVDAGCGEPLDIDIAKGRSSP